MVGQPDNLNSLYTPDEIKAMLDLPPEEVRVFINSFISLLGSTSIDNWLYQQIVAVVAGGVADASLDDVKLSNAVGQIKERFTTHQSLSSSETIAAHVELATATETTTGTDNTRAVHPAGLKVELDKKIPLTQKGAASGVGTLDSGGHPVEKTYITGVYTGDGTASRLINIGFTPSAALVFPQNGLASSTNVFGGLAIAGTNVLGGAGALALSIVTNGFNVYFSLGTSPYAETNQSSITYIYIAFR